MTNVSNILDNLNSETGLEVNKLEKSLKITKKKDRDNLGIALTALEKIGILKTIDNDKIVVNKETDLLKGRVRCSSKGYCFVVREDEGDDIYIREADLNNAWHGDYVIVKVTKEALRRRAPEGSIQCVLKRYNDILLTKIDIDKSDGLLKAYPLDDRINAIIEIKSPHKEFIESSKEEAIYEIKIEKYPIAQYNAIGSIIRELSLNAGSEGDVEILLSKNKISKTLNFPKVSPKKITSKNRENFTLQPSLLFTSWDNNKAPCLPALFAQPHDGGTRVWLHSPTISERLNIGGKLDEILKEQGEVICLGNNWLDYLPQTLKSASEFNVNQESDALTLVIDINSTGIVTDWRFTLSRIKPHQLVTTKHIQKLINRKPTSKSIPIALKPIKDHLEAIYTIIHTSKLINSIDNGSIELDINIPNLSQISELQKNYPSRDFNGWIKSYDISDPQSILDVFIRLSNNILAKHLTEYELPYIYKQHDDIDQSSINELSKSALALDKKITLNSDGSITTVDLLKSFESSSEKMILHKLVKHVIPGINLKLYSTNNNYVEEVRDNSISIERIEAPWCCPSTNYWNISNQYIISLLLTEGKNKLTSRSKEIIDLGRKDSWNQIDWLLFSPKVEDLIKKHFNLKLIQKLNEIRKKSKQFRNNIISMAQGREAQKIIGKEVNAIITGVQSYGFFAEIIDLTAEGLVHVSTLGDDWYEYRSRQNLLVGRKNKKTYQLAQKINVRVLKVDILKNQIDLELVNKDEVETNDSFDNPTMDTDC